MISIQQLVEICARPEWMRPDAGEDRQIKEAQIKGVGVTWLEERGGGRAKSSRLFWCDYLKYLFYLKNSETCGLLRNEWGFSRLLLNQWAVRKWNSWAIVVQEVYPWWLQPVFWIRRYLLLFLLIEGITFSLAALCKLSAVYCGAHYRRQVFFLG